MPVHLLSGPVGAGKTTRLLAWAAGRADVGGVASPRTGDGDGRAFVDLASGERRPMDAAAGEAALEVGRFRFSAEAFAWAAGRVRDALADPGRRWVALDEVGPLELGGRGFAPLVPALLEAPDRNVVLVVREGLVSAVLERWGLAGRARPFDPAA